MWNAVGAIMEVCEVEINCSTSICHATEMENNVDTCLWPLIESDVQWLTRLCYVILSSYIVEWGDTCPAYTLGWYFPIPCRSHEMLPLEPFGFRTLVATKLKSQLETTFMMHCRPWTLYRSERSTAGFMKLSRMICSLPMPVQMEPRCWILHNMDSDRITWPKMSRRAWSDASGHSIAWSLGLLPHTMWVV